jgi:hypothetical protein
MIGVEGAITSLLSQLLHLLKLAAQSVKPFYDCLIVRCGKLAG